MYYRLHPYASPRRREPEAILHPGWTWAALVLLAVLILALFLTCPALAWDDVPADHFAFSAIDAMTATHFGLGRIMEPCSETRFCPDGLVHRDELAVFLLKAYYGPTYKPPTAVLSCSWDDVPLDHPQCSYMKRLRAEGWASGCARSGGPNEFNYCPDLVVTRAHVAVLILRARHGGDFAPMLAQGYFADVAFWEWFASWIEQFAREGLTSGCAASPPLYCPHRPITRAELAVFLARSFVLWVY